MRRLAARLIAIAAAILGTGLAYGAAHRTYRPISGPIRFGDDHLRSQRSPRDQRRRPHLRTRVAPVDGELAGLNGLMTWG